MNIVITNKTRSKEFKPYYYLFDQVAKVAEKELELKDDYTISVILVRSKKIKEINRDYRNIDRVTDVISFAINDQIDDYEMMETEKELGDVFINVDYAYLQAKEYGHSFEREFAFLFLHGLLHCLGHDHMQKEDEEVMFKIQDLIIDQVVKREI